MNKILFIAGTQSNIQEMIDKGISPYQNGWKVVSVSTSCIDLTTLGMEKDIGIHVVVTLRKKWW